MRRYVPVFPMSFGLSLIMVAACSDGQATQRDAAQADIDPGVFAGVQEPLPAPTPHAAIENLLRAVHQRDQVLYAASLNGTAEDMAFACERFATEAMLHEFFEAMERSFGRHKCQTLLHFTDLDRRSRWPRPDAASSGLRITSEGPRALAVLPAQNSKLLHLNAVNGKWYVSIGEHLPSPADRPAILDAYRRLRPIIRRVRPLVARPGISADSVWTRFLEEIDPPAWMQTNSDSPEV